MGNTKINNISSEINKIILDNKLEKIIEMTYSYGELGNDLFYNLTLFDDFGGFFYNKEGKKDFNVIKISLDEKIKLIINELLLLIEELKQEALDDRGKILYKSILYIKKILKVVLLGLDFELEKAGYNLTLSKEEQLNIVSRIEEIEEENFGLKIKNNKSEIKLIYDFLFSLFIDTKSKISQSEQLFFLEYINKLNNFLDKSDLKVKEIKSKKLESKFWSKNISRDNYIKLFNYILENIYKLDQKAIITNASSIYDGEKYLEIPSKDTHSNLTYKRVLGLIVHEIESHYINSFNNKVLLGNFRGARNLEKEEGLAKVMEAFLFGDNEMSAVFVPTYMAKILFAELYSGDDFYRFIDIYNKMHTLRRYPFNEFLRQKRNYSLSLNGGQHKDISYGRGMIKTLDYLKNGGDFSLLFMGKVGFEDLDRILSLYEENKSKLLFPIFIGDIIALYLQDKEKGIKFELDLDEIVGYLEKKYHFKGIERFKLKENIGKKMGEIKELLGFIDNL